MKYSIIGNLSGILPDSEEESQVLGIVNAYSPIWRLNPNTYSIKEDDGTIKNHMGFEVWLENEIDKDNLFSDMKNLVDQFTGTVGWHICTHDEESPRPCQIIETYSR